MIPKTLVAFTSTAAALLSIRYFASRVPATMSTVTLPKSRPEWRAALDALPSTPENIPAFFFAHGSPMLEMPGDFRLGMDAQSADGALADFLRDFGPALLQKYKPKGLVVFSAHWEEDSVRQVTDYGDDQPLLYDYYNFSPELYKIQFHSNGDSNLSKLVVDTLQEAGQKARLTNKTESRGRDGRGFFGPGLDHGVFVPFRKMFGETLTEVPLVQVSIDGSLDPQKNWELGQAVAKLRKQGYLIISGGLMIHNLRDFASFGEKTASPIHKEFNSAILEAITIPDTEERRKALIGLTKHHGFRAAHPREEHFVPLYIAAGAGDVPESSGEVRVLHALYGAPTFAFL